MSICSRCGAQFSCGMQDGSGAPCWCTALPAALPLPLPRPDRVPASCWCAGCLKAHIAACTPPLDRPR